MPLKLSTRTQTLLGASVIATFTLSTALSFFSLQTARQELQNLIRADFKAIALVGDLTYQIQESRRRSLYVIAVKDPQRRSAYAELVQEPDVQASIVHAKLTGLTLPPAAAKRLAEFDKDWTAYESIRDTVVLLGLQQRDSDALTLEATRGRPLFEMALASLKAAKGELSESAAKRASAVEDSFDKRIGRVALSSLTALLLVGGLLLVIVRHKRAVLQLTNAEELARRQQQWLESVQDVGSIGLWEMGSNPDYVRYSQHELTLLGLPADTASFSAERFLEMVHPDDRALVLVKSEGERRQDFEREFRVRRLDGEERWLLARGTIFRSPEEQRWHIVGIHLDITERKTVEQELMAAREKADAGTRAKSEFLATMSHELRTPLNGVIGMGSLLQQTSLDDLQTECVEVILASSQLLVQLINDILDLSKLEAERVHLADSEFRWPKLVEECAGIVRGTATGKGLHLRLHTSHRGTGLVLGDDRKLKQVILNLLSNAVKFTSSGGVDLFAQVEQSSKDLVRLRIEVQDTGIGIAESALHTLFERFTQVDSSDSRKYGGSGLGLAISQRIVKLMGGQISVASTEGVGSRFWFTVPLQVCHRESQSHLEGEATLVA